MHDPAQLHERKEPVMCRHCKYYRPREQFRGVIGYCDKNKRPVEVKDSCESEEKGEQHWMNGEPVKE